MARRLVTPSMTSRDFYVILQSRRIRKLGGGSTIRAEPLSTHYRPSGRHLGDLFWLHLRDPVLVASTYVLTETW